MKRFLLIIAPALFSIISFGQIRDTPSLITEQYKRYHGKFNSNITFVQVNTFYKPDGTSQITTSFEAFHYPGKYRVDFGPEVNQDGEIILNDSTFEFTDGKLVKKTLGSYDILTLTGDVYFLLPAETLKKLTQQGFNTAEFREDTWKNTPVYVIGAKKGDNTTSQFWIDKENLYLIRIIHPTKEGILDEQFLEHEIVGKAWVESEVQVFLNGTKIRKERYTEVKADNQLHKDLFDPKKWGTVHWKK
jgi:hypothetical protein